MMSTEYFGWKSVLVRCWISFGPRTHDHVPQRECCLQVTHKVLVAFLQTPECHQTKMMFYFLLIALLQWMEREWRKEKHITKNIKGRTQGAFGLFSSSLFNQRRKTDMSNHNKTSAGKWAFAITVSQHPLERPSFLDINQRFMGWFLYSLFNYSCFFNLLNHWSISCEA